MYLKICLIPPIFVNLVKIAFNAANFTSNQCPFN